MKNLILMLSLVFCVASSTYANEQDFIDQQRLQDLTQLQLDLAQDRELMGQESLEDILQTKELNHDCDDDRPNRPGRGGGSAACWSSCNYSISTCASTCGVQTPAAQAACWGKCNYSISTCASTCGVDTRAGSAACWGKCNYSQSTCASTCGTN